MCVGSNSIQPGKEDSFTRPSKMDEDKNDREDGEGSEAESEEEDEEGFDARLEDDLAVSFSSTAVHHCCCCCACRRGGNVVDFVDVCRTLMQRMRRHWRSSW